ncbi:hypothetical protein [Runella limosa]|jgi:hypothetical protein|uniref:hypothetical protein n=1 Tax=Runella limosa TaxID=370978 RepID=UPI000409713D|nr:hypothetical protein [Runella limosa]
MATTKLTVPNWFKAGYISRIDGAPLVDVGKIVAIHSVDSDISDFAKLARGYSHVPKIWDADTPKHQKCFILLSDIFEGVGHSDAQIDGAAGNVASRITPAACIGDQFTEAGSNPIPWDNGSYWTIGKKFYQYLGQKLGVSGAHETNFFHNYDTKLVNFSEFLKVDGVRNPLHPYFVSALTSEAGARKKATSTGGVQDNDPYYNSGMVDFTNSFTMMLWANDGDTQDWLYGGIFEAQRKYAAKENAKTVMYSSPWAQSLANPVNEHHKNPGWIHPRTGGYWKVPDWHVVPLELMLWTGFFGCLLTEGVYNWEKTDAFSKDVANDRPNAWTPNRTWVSEGGAQPNLLPDGEPRYPQYPRAGQDAAVLGAHWYNTVKPIVNASTGVRYLTYTTNGQTINPQAGDARLFRRGFRNYGQTTILHHAANKRGLALGCEGGGQKFACYVNPYKLPSEREHVTVTVGGTTYDLGNLEGSKLHVYTF